MKTYSREPTPHVQIDFDGVGDLSDAAYPAPDRTDGRPLIGSNMISPEVQMVIISLKHKPRFQALRSLSRI
jgi:hypothetical protein